MKDPSAVTTHRQFDDRYLPPLLFVSVLLLIGAVHFAMQWHVPLPVCWLRALTGIPCPGCGSTRCVFALSNFDLAQAFLFNPLTFLACAGVAGWFVLWTADLLLRRGWTTGIRRLLRRLPLTVIIPVAVFFNWVYLYFTLPPK